MHGRHERKYRNPKSRFAPFEHYLGKSPRTRVGLCFIVTPSNGVVNKSLMFKITEHLSTTCIWSRDITAEYDPALLPNSCLIRSSNAASHQMERGFHLSHMWQYCFEGLFNDRIQKGGTGNCNPVAYGARCCCRNCR